MDKRNPGMGVCVTGRLCFTGSALATFALKSSIPRMPHYLCHRSIHTLLTTAASSQIFVTLHFKAIYLISLLINT